ncbi:MAG: hypothetical protein NT062_23855 [Proteobacteria bacterium]|nr:hypothetical protein [Pseudomonadota bacterium]
MRAELREARLVGNVDAISIAHLAVAHALVEDHRLGAAAQELESAVAWAQQHALPEHRWPLLLSLAAVCDGAGETDRAERLAANALEASITAHSDVGRRRAEQLVHRLAVRRPSQTQQVTRSARSARR